MRRTSLILLGLQVAVVGWAAAQALPAYDRDAWPHWSRVGETCQDTRQDVLVRWALKDTMHPLRLSEDGCRVLEGLWVDPWAGDIVADPRALDIDHTVPLAEAHRSGGHAWTRAQREAYANDTDYRYHLIPLLAKTNRSKGAKPPQDWRPSGTSWSDDRACRYGQAWATIKFLYALEATAAERDAVRTLVRTC